MSLRISLEGDKAKAASFLGWARSKLFMLKANMKLLRIKQGRRFFALDGLNVFISSLFGQDEIRIVAEGGVLVYVADTLNHRIQVFDINGIFKFSFGSYGEDDGQFLYPFDLDHYGGKLYVGDKLQGNIINFTPEGEFISKKFEDKYVWRPMFNENGLMEIAETALHLWTYFYNIDSETKDLVEQHSQEWPYSDYAWSSHAIDNDKFFIAASKSSGAYKGLFAYSLSDYSLIQEITRPSGHGYNKLKCYKGKLYGIAWPPTCPNPAFEPCIDVYDIATLTFEKTIAQGVFRSLCDGYNLAGLDVHETGIWVTEYWAGAGASPLSDSDNDSDRVLHLDFEGNLIRAFGTKGSATRQFFKPMGIKIIEITGSAGAGAENIGEDNQGGYFYNNYIGGPASSVYNGMGPDEPFPVISVNESDVTIEKAFYDLNNNVTVYGYNSGGCDSQMTVKVCGMGDSVEWETGGGVVGQKYFGPWITLGGGCHTSTVSNTCSGGISSGPWTGTVIGSNGKKATIVVSNSPTGAGGTGGIGGWGDGCFSGFPQGAVSIVPGFNEQYTSECKDGTPAWTLEAAVAGVSISVDGLLSADPGLTPCDGGIGVQFGCCGAETVIKSVEIFNPCSAITIVNEDGSAATDTILRNGSLDFKTTGCCSGGITWAVSVDAGSTLGGSTISSTGALTAGATSCGSLKVTATCESCGTSATQYVRVTDAGQWVVLSDADNHSSLCIDTLESNPCVDGASSDSPTTCETISGYYKYVYTSYKSRIPLSYGLVNGCPILDTTFIFYKPCPVPILLDNPCESLNYIARLHKRTLVWKCP